MPTRRQAIIWTNDDRIYWRIYAKFGLNDLFIMLELTYSQLETQQLRYLNTNIIPFRGSASKNTICNIAVISTRRGLDAADDGACENGYAPRRYDMSYFSRIKFKWRHDKIHLQTCTWTNMLQLVLFANYLHWRHTSQCSAGCVKDVVAKLE